MFGERIDFNGREGAEADMKGDFGDFDAGGLDAMENFLGEVEPGGGGGDGAGGLGEDGLVALGIGGLGAVFATDVGREWHFAEARGVGEEIGSAGELKAVVAFVGFFEDLGMDWGALAGAFQKLKDGALADAFAGFEHDPPVVRGDFFNE